MEDYSEITKLPIEEDNEVEVMDGEIPEEGEGSQDNSEFIDNLNKLMALMSETCQGEFNKAMAEQNMEVMSEACKFEFSNAAGQTKGFREMQDERVRKSQGQAQASPLGPTPNPNTKYYLSATLFLLFVVIIGYIMWVNKKLKDAGLWESKRKPLSKKKMMKEKMKEEARKKIK